MNPKQYLRSIKLGLRAQLMLTTVVPVMALLIAVSLVGIFAFTRLTQTLIEERDSELVQFAAQQVAGHWADSVLLLTDVASRNSVRSGDVLESQLLLEKNVALWQRFDRISITDSRGVVVASEGGEIGENVGLEDYFGRARRLRLPIRSLVHRNTNGESVIVVAVAVYDLQGQFSGCVLGVWEVGGDRLGLPLANVRVGQNGFAYLVSETGVILFYPQADLLLADAHRHPAVAAVLRGESGALTVNERGDTNVVGYTPILSRQLRTSSLLADRTWDGWGLLTSQSWDDIVAPLQPYVRLMVALMALAVIFPLTFLALNSRRVVAPVQSLVEQAERVASGELDTQVSINSGPREIRELELAFNVMVAQLRKYRSDIQRYLASILNSQEDERKRIARELHDDTAQALIVLGRRIEMAEEQADKPELAEELGDLRDMLDDTLQGVRRFTSDLRPPLLEELGLPRTLEILGGRIEREEALRVEVTISGEPQVLLPELELGLYRLAQESLSNVRRHARATRAKLHLAYKENSVELSISDDGVGFRAPTDLGELLKLGRLGLMGIYERARLFGGKATIDSGPGQGTVVQIVVPLTAIVLPVSSEVN